MSSRPKIPKILEDLLDRSSEASVILDLERRILYYNDAYQRLVPHTEAELKRLVERGARCIDVFPLSICETACAGRKSMASDQAAVTHEVVALQGGEDKSLSVFATSSGDGYFVETYRSVDAGATPGAQLSDQLLRERELNASLEAAVKARTKQLNVAHQQLVVQEKMSALGRLVAGIAHELNNPINFVYGNIDFLEGYVRDLLSIVELVDESEETSPEFRLRLAQRKGEIRYDYLIKDCSKLIESIRTGAERSASIVSDLKNFSRTSAASFHDFDLVRGVETTLSLIGPLIKNRIEIRRQFADDIPHIRCNGGHINQVLMNLLTNAAQAIEGEGTIEITIETIDAGEQVRIQVADTGHGIADADREKITDPFFTTKDVGEGTGMGLWITMGIVHRHGGMLACHSEPGNGAVFTVTLPVVPKLEGESKS